MFKVIPFVEMGAIGGMSFAVTSAKVLSHKGPMAIRKIATVDLFRGMVKCMATEVFGARVTLSTAFEGAFKLAIREDFTTASPPLGGLIVGLHFPHAISTVPKNSGFGQRRIGEEEERES